MSEHAQLEAFVSRPYHPHCICGLTDTRVSSTPGQRASCAHPPPRFNLTATLQILIAATAATQLRTKDMEPSTAQRPSLSSRASSVAHPLARQPHLLLHLRRQLRVLGHVLLSMDNVVVRDGLARLAVPLVPARLRMPTIHSACEETLNFKNLTSLDNVTVGALCPVQSWRRTCCTFQKVVHLKLRHLPIASLYSLTRLSALSSRFIPSFIAVESSTRRGQDLKIRSMTGSVSSLTY